MPRNALTGVAFACFMASVALAAPEASNNNVGFRREYTQQIRNPNKEAAGPNGYML